MHPMNFGIFIFAFLFSAVYTTKYDTNSMQYSVPKATIKAFLPIGLSVSIPDSPGLSLFAFHGNINSKLGPLEGGTLSKEILRSNNGLWTFTDASVKINVNDVINYFLYVEKDGQGYRQDIQHFTVKELHYDQQSTNSIAEDLLMESSNLAFKQSTVLSGDIHHHHHYYNDPSSSSLPNTPSSLPQCHQSDNKSNEFFEKITKQLNVVLMQLQTLHDKTAPLKSKVDSLEEVIGELLKEKDNSTKLLFLGTKLPPSDSNAYEAIRGVLTDVLDLPDLSASIKFAEIVNGCIEFEMANSIDKFRILIRAQDRFNTDKRKIIDFRLDKDHKSNSQIPEIFYRSGGTESSVEEKEEEPKTEIVDRFLFE